MQGKKLFCSKFVCDTELLRGVGKDSVIHSGRLCHLGTPTKEMLCCLLVCGID